MRTQPSPLTRWLLVLVISMGVVAMHSVVGVCAGPDEGHGGGPAMSRTGDGQLGGTHHAGHPGPPGPTENSVGSRGAGAASAPPDRHDAGGCSALGHLCLAILNALGLVVLLGLMLLASITRSSGTAEAGGSSARGARSPPVDRPPSRTSLTRLCVSRR